MEQNEKQKEMHERFMRAFKIALKEQDELPAFQKIQKEIDEAERLTAEDYATIVGPRK